MNDEEFEIRPESGSWLKFGLLVVMLLLVGLAWHAEDRYIQPPVFEFRTIIPAPWPWVTVVAAPCGPRTTVCESTGMEQGSCTVYQGFTNELSTGSLLQSEPQ